MQKKRRRKLRLNLPARLMPNRRSLSKTGVRGTKPSCSGGNSSKLPMPLHYRNLFSPLKMNYIKGDRPKVDCILCAVLHGDERVDNLLVYRSERAFVCVNKYPYNSGHLLVCPKRHITDYRETTQQEEREMDHLVKRCLSVLDELYHPTGYNVGYNMGEFAGASQEHLHIHLIPRYRNELGFVDIVGGAKILVEEPQVTMSRLKSALEKSAH